MSEHRFFNDAELKQFDNFLDTDYVSLTSQLFQEFGIDSDDGMSDDNSMNTPEKILIFRQIT